MVHETAMNQAMKMFFSVDYSDMKNAISRHLEEWRVPAGTIFGQDVYMNDTGSSGR